MSSEQDSELRADFVNESRDLLQKLAEQLVELERNSDDRELLNAIFRGFHTVKGGAGFFALEPIVELCHASEDVFNGLRAGRITITPAMMDVVLESVDDLREMMEAVAVGHAPAPAKKKLVKQLREFADGASAGPPAAAPAPAPAAPAPLSAIAAASADPFSEDEFDKLLDQIHGTGAAPGTPGAAAAPAAPAQPSAIAAASADPFKDDEFDKLLDQLHGSGGVPGAPTAPAAVHHEPAREAPPPPRRSAPAKTAPEVEKPAAAARAPTEPAAETSVRVDTERLDHVMNLVGELVLVRNRMKNIGPGTPPDIMRKAFSELDVITAGLQSSIMQMRMQPIRKLFSRFPRLVRETARKVNKEVNVEIRGDTTELDKSLVEALNDPLVHMIRNAVDHGIEAPDARIAAGKSQAGTLMLAAEQAGDHILISVKDDGGGMDPERLRRKAIEKGLLDAQTAANLSQEESLQLIFMPGFSTKEQISDLSGRGVGMDVVKSNISALNGSVQIESMIGRGSAFHIRVPLTLAIQPVLMIALGPRMFALPLQPVQDVFFLDETKIRRLDRWDAILYRNETLRLVRMSRWAGTMTGPDNGAHVVVVRVGSEKFGLIVTQVRGREEIVVKPLGRMLRGLAGIGGATVTGDGRVALIVDLGGLVAAYEQSL